MEKKTWRMTIQLTSCLNFAGLILVQICVLELNVQSVFLLLSTKDRCSDFNKRPHEDSRRDEGLPQAYSNFFEEIDTGHNSDDSRLRTAKIFTVKKKGEMNLLFHSQKEKRGSRTTFGKALNLFWTSWSGDENQPCSQGFLSLRNLVPRSRSAIMQKEKKKKQSLFSISQFNKRNRRKIYLSFNVIQKKIVEIKRKRKIKSVRWPGIEPGSTAWKAAMLTTIPPTPTC